MTMEASQMITNIEIALDRSLRKERPEGKLEGKLEVVKKLLDKGISIEDEAQFTDVGIEDLKKI